MLVVLLIVAANVAVVMLAGPASQMLSRAPELGAAFAEKLHILDRPLAAFSELQAALGINPAEKRLSTSIPSRIARGMLTIVTPAALQFVLSVVMFFATLFFFILGRAGFRKYAVNWFASRTARLRALKILNDIEDNLGGYLIVVTAINLALGIVTTIAAMLMGLPSPILWGALAFVLNYIPYVGPAIMYVLLFVIGLLTYPTLLGALMPPAVFMGITADRGPVPDAGDRRPARAQSASAGDFSQHRVLGLAVGAGRGVPGDADPDHRPRRAGRISTRTRRPNCPDRHLRRGRLSVLSSTAARTSCSIIVQMRST